MLWLHELPCQSIRPRAGAEGTVRNGAAPEDAHPNGLLAHNGTDQTRGPGWLTAAGRMSCGRRAAAREWAPQTDCAIAVGSFQVLNHAAGAAPCQRMGNVCGRLVCHITEILACHLREAPTNGACEEKDHV